MNMGKKKRSFKAALTLRQEFATLLLSYAVTPGRMQWFEQGFEVADERRYMEWLENQLRGVRDQKV